MTATLAFDVYGTLIDTAGIAAALTPHVGERAADFSHLWRDKQLEYSFRRGLMQNYQPFSVCTRQALDYVCASLRVALTEKAKIDLLDAYQRLPAFADVRSGLPELQGKGYALFAFSNGPAEDVGALLVNANLEQYFQDIVSVDEIRSFKPNPGVYAHCLRRIGAVGAEAWLVSSNPFDVIGAVSAGMRAAWIKRRPDAVFDPWDIEPTLTVGDLGELAAALPSARR